MKIKEFQGSLNPIFDENIKKNINPLEEGTGIFLPIDSVKPKHDQPRKIFNDESINELVKSIKSYGIIQPIVVKQAKDGLYEIIVGERRWRAAKKAGLEKIAVVIREYDRMNGMITALIENIQRENLNPLEEAEAIQILIQECEMTHQQIAESIGRSRTTVTNLLRLINLSDTVKIMINSGFLEMGHARALLSLSSEKQIEAAKLIIDKNLSVRESEKLVRRINFRKQKKKITIDSEVEKKIIIWKKLISQWTLSKVNVQFSDQGKGRVVIHFDSLEKVSWLMEHMAFTEKQSVQ